MPGEEWRAVVGFEGAYEVSDLGRVRSVTVRRVYHRIDQYSGRRIEVSRLHQGRVLRPATAKSGHMSLVLGRAGGSRLVHALVLEAFAGPRPPGKEALHGNGIPSDNRLVNLRWGTRSENLLDAVRHGQKPVGERAWNSKLTTRDVLAIRSRFGSVSHASLAREFGVSDGVIRAIGARRSWKHVGEQHVD